MKIKKKVCVHLRYFNMLKKKIRWYGAPSCCDVLCIEINNLIKRNLINFCHIKAKRSRLKDSLYESVSHEFESQAQDLHVRDTCTQKSIQTYANL